MPAKSSDQKKFMQLALGVKKGDIDKNEVSQNVVDAAESMSKEELEKYANEPVEEQRFRNAIRKIIREEFAEVSLGYGDRGNNTVKFSTDQSEEPIGLVPIQAANSRNKFEIKTTCSKFLNMATEGGSPNEWMAEQIRDGRLVAPPWLEMV